MKKASGKAENEIKRIIFRFLDPKKHQVFVFGSRATGRAEKFSDYDVGIWGKKPVPLAVLSMIEETLEASDLPYKVDVVDFSLVSEKFKRIALLDAKRI